MIENKLLSLGHGMSEALMEGVGEFIEMFLSYLTNSISYVRLGAFAVAHVALAEVAYILSPSIGFLPSYLLFNILVIILEGFSAGIQSVRLIFYEFSTKFYRDEGRLFRPLRI
jgi:V/A-type H+-transporting ATPase subunit I